MAGGGQLDSEPQRSYPDGRDGLGRDGLGSDQVQTGSWLWYLTNTEAFIARLKVINWTEEMTRRHVPAVKPVARKD